MVIQYLIDWENLLSDVAGNRSERMCEQVLRLMGAIRRNGVLVNSSYVERAILQRKSIENNRLIDRVLDEVIAVYRDFGERVDSVDNPAITLNDTINGWCAYLRGTGVSFRREDFRCVLVSTDGSNDCEFYCCQSLENVLETCNQWTRLLHFNDDTSLDFKKYMEAFSASAKEYVRIYDPYLSNIFNTVQRSRCVKAWRNSLYYILGIILRNNHIKIIDVITTENNNKLLFAEIIQDIITPCSAYRGNGNIVELAFHFVDSQRSFHDRFLSNGRFCFAIGHGCDVCKVDESHIELERKESRGAQIYRMQWRNMPHLGDERFSDFNVFYGCSKNDVPSDIPVFKNRGTDKNGCSIIYPNKCRARILNDIRERLDGVPKDQQNPVFFNNRVRVSVNPLTCADDF